MQGCLQPVTSIALQDSPLTAYHCLQSENDRESAKGKIWFPSKKWAPGRQSLFPLLTPLQDPQHRGQSWAFNVSVQWDKIPQPHANQEMPIDEARRHGRVRTPGDGVGEGAARWEPGGQCPGLAWTAWLYTLHLVELPRDKSHCPECPAVDCNSHVLPVCENQYNHTVAWFGNIHLWWRWAAFQSNSSAPGCASWRIPHTSALGLFFFFFLQACELYPCFQGLKTETNFQTLSREIDTSVAM